MQVDINVSNNNEAHVEQQIDKKTQAILIEDKFNRIIRILKRLFTLLNNNQGNG